MDQARFWTRSMVFVGGIVVAHSGKLVRNNREWFDEYMLYRIG